MSEKLIKKLIIEKIAVKVKSQNEDLNQTSEKYQIYVRLPSIQSYSTLFLDYT